jgi:hypothetical protein
LQDPRDNPSTNPINANPIFIDVGEVATLAMDYTSFLGDETKPADERMISRSLDLVFFFLSFFVSF